MDGRSLVDYAASLDCVHCGLCLAACPTYAITGWESSSPRGRILLMRAVAEDRLSADRSFAEEIDFCLGCRACESACPAGVRFGEMLEHTRDALSRDAERSALARLARWAAYRVLLPHRAALRLLSATLRAAQLTGALRILATLLGKRGEPLRALPRVPPLRDRRALPERTPAEGAPRGVVALFEGCVMPELFGRVNRASAAVLAAIGIESRLPRRRSPCCGALHAHDGDLEGARALARRTIETYGELRDEEGAPLPIAVASAGCGAHMRSYGRLLAEDPEWAERASAFATRVRDLSELLVERLPSDLRPRLSNGSLPSPVAYDDPCHLCHGQGVRAQPRALLDAIGGLERVELEESEACCGSAGSWSLRRPADSAAVFERRLEAFRASGARALITANPGCHLQWEAGLRRAGLDAPVLHVAEVLERAWRHGGQA